MHIDKKFDKANRIVDSYMIYEKAERLKFFYRFLKLFFFIITFSVFYYSKTKVFSAIVNDFRYFFRFSPLPCTLQ